MMAEVEQTNTKLPHTEPALDPNRGTIEPLRDPTLQLPRILCLHGGGTNSRIFQAQCRAMRSKLEKHFRLVFTDAPYFSHAGPDVEYVYAEWLPFRSWRRPGYAFGDPSPFTYADEEEIEKIDEALAAAMKRDDKAGGTGEWVGLLGFSQGATLSASLLRRQQTWNMDVNSGLTPSAPATNFRFAVLMAGCGPLLWMRSDVVDSDRLEREKYELLHLPTLHVHGLKDERIAMHRKLAESCKISTTEVIEWGGDHRVPIKTADVARLVDGIVNVAKKAGVPFDK
ncbi:hypothetical protein FAVG1_08383 [Fusarium avenaceum]|nr:hypothetical protein FAVG1_08383 [Fusarium avenaceum]